MRNRVVTLDIRFNIHIYVCVFFFIFKRRNGIKRGSSQSRLFSVFFAPRAARRRRCPHSEELINKRQPLLFVFIINVIIHFPDH